MRNQIISKILSFILVMTFTKMLALSPGLVNAQIIGNLDFVNDITDTASGEGWSWDQDVLTLTLDGLELNGDGESTYAIGLPDNSTIVLQGTNLVKIDVGHGIFCDGNLTITGSGVLDIIADDAGMFLSDDAGIFSYGTVTISGGTVNINIQNMGIFSYDIVTISGGTVNIATGTRGFGIYTYEKVIIDKGTLNIDSGIEGYGIHGGDVIISGGTVNISVIEYGSGIYSDTTITISGGNVNINASGTGLFGEILISGGNVNINAQDIGIYSNHNIIIDNCTLNIVSDRYAIYTNYDVEITGGSVTAVGGTSVSRYAITTLPTTYTWWASDTTSAPSGMGTASITVPYTWSDSHKYVRFVEGAAGEGLIFDTVSGKFWNDVNSDESLDTGDVEYLDQSGAWSWDQGTSTLNLNGFTYTTTNVFNALTIVGSGSLNINVSGTNTFAVDQVPGNGMSSGIYVDTGINLTITGSGILNAQGSSSSVHTYLYSYGIHLENGDMTINSGTVNATGGDVDITGSSEGIGIYKGTLTINGGVVNAKGGAAVGTNGWSGGAYADGLVVNGGTLNATGGTSGAYSCGVYAGNGDITVNTGGTVNATGGTTGDYSFGVYVYWNININGGTLNGTGGTADSSCGVETTGNITISGGTLNGTGGAATSGDSYGVYLYSGTLTITGSTLIASGQTGAINAAPNISALSTYTYWTNESAADPGGNGTTVPGVTGYTWSIDHKYLKITTEITSGGTTEGTTTGGTTKTGGAAKTSDNSNMYVWSALALISVLSICVAVRKRRSAVK